MKMIVHTSDIPFHIIGFGTVKTADSVIFIVKSKMESRSHQPSTRFKDHGKYRQERYERPARQFYRPQPWLLEVSWNPSP